MIKVKYIEITNENFLKALKTLTGLDLPIKYAREVTKLHKTIEEELVIYDKEKMKIINKFCEKNDKGEPIVTEDYKYKFSKENGVPFNKEIFAILETEIDIKIDPINISEWENVNIKAETIISLGKLVS